MAYQQPFVTYPGDGTTGPWQVPFPSISETYVFGDIDGVFVGLIWESTSHVRTNIPVPVGSTLTIQRATEKTKLLAVVRDDSTLPAEVLNLVSTQLLYLFQENERIRGGGIPEAPTDGATYGRRGGAWQSITATGVPEAPVDGKQYVRQDAAWAEVEIPQGLVTEAPMDGGVYVRFLGQWAQMPQYSAGYGLALDIGDAEFSISDPMLNALQAAGTPVQNKMLYFVGSGAAAQTDLSPFARTLLDDTSATAMRTTLGLTIGTNVQGWDSNLQTITSQVMAANTSLYWTANGSAQQMTVTPFARTLLDDTTQAAMRTTLGLTPGTDVQAYDAKLQAIAGLASTADTAPYFTGSGTAALMPVTSAARTVLDDTSVAAMRTTLGVAVGTDVQAYDADLAAIAGLNYTANTAPYFTGPGAASLMTVSAAGRALIDDADAAAQRTTLGLTIGANVQAFDADLTALAGLSYTADSVPYFTGPGAASLMTVTAAARGLLDDASTADMLATLGALPAAGGTMSGDLYQATGAYVMGATAKFTTRANTSPINPNYQVLSTGANASMMLARFSPDAFNSRFFFAKSRGATVGSHGACSAGDVAGEFTYGWSNGTAICEGARFLVTAEEAPGTVYTPARFSFLTSPPGATGSPIERFAISAAGDLQMGGTNTVVGANRHFRLRSYTLATLPVGSAGDMIFVSNGSSNRRLATYDGAAWCWADGITVS